MRNTRRTGLLSLLLLVTAGTSAVSALDTYSPRQYYGAWQKHPRFDYYYRGYYYKPHADYSGYKHHYVVLHPSRPTHCYFYNPYQKKYWGRCPLQHEGKPQYSHLAPEYQKPNLADVPESAFPPYGGLPALPESTDGAKLDLPPDDLPDDIKGGAAAP